MSTDVTPDGSPVPVYLAIPAARDFATVIDDLYPGMSVLDLGCGAGRLANELARRGHEVVGVDESPDMLAHLDDDVEAVEARIEDLEVSGMAGGSLQARVLAPAAPVRPKRCLILLHGLGETARVELGLKAWSHLYGLLDAHRRLATPPVERDAQLGYFPETRLAELNRSLKRQPYVPMVLICPITPRPARAASRQQLFDDYSRWLVQRLLPTVESKYPTCTRAVGLDGCSMGGYVATEVLLRRPGAFATFGVVQSAIGEWRVPGYIEKLSRIHEQYPRLAMHLQTSTRDPFKQATVALAKGLRRERVPHRLDVLPGPHDQPWLREVGTLTLLRWHDLELPR